MFGFPKAERLDIESHKRHYLKSVIFQVKFKPTDEINTNKKKITSIFEDLLPRVNDKIYKGGFEISFRAEQTPIIQSVEQDDSIFGLRSNDGQKILSFTKDTITLTISGNVYKSFENIEKKISMLEEVFRVCEITSFNRVAIRKINIIEFEISRENETNPMQIMRLILNPELLSSAAYFPQPEYIQQNIHTINYIKENNRLKLRYGLIVPRVNVKIGQILIDIDLFTVDEVSTDSLKSLSTEINSEIFNIFNWAISEEAKEKLKE